MFRIFFRGKTDEKLKRSEPINKDEVLDVVGKLLDTQPEIRLKIRRCNNG
ncbi:hypothetical protein ACFL96_13455 [Thermoproteota archaeon]